MIDVGANGWVVGHGIENMEHGTWDHGVTMAGPAAGRVATGSRLVGASFGEGLRVGR